MTYTEPVKLGVKRFPPIKHGITYSKRNGIPKAEDVLYIGAFVTFIYKHILCTTMPILMKTYHITS